MPVSTDFRAIVEEQMENKSFRRRQNTATRMHNIISEYTQEDEARRDARRRADKAEEKPGVTLDTATRTALEDEAASDKIPRRSGGDLTDSDMLDSP